MTGRYGEDWGYIDRDKVMVHDKSDIVKRSRRGYKRRRRRRKGKTRLIGK